MGEGWLTRALERASPKNLGAQFFWGGGDLDTQILGWKCFIIESLKFKSDLRHLHALSLQSPNEPFTIGHVVGAQKLFVEPIFIDKPTSRI